MKINSLNQEYFVILTYDSDKYNKSYLVYTDNKYINDKLKIYISSYNKGDLQITTKDITDEKEKKDILEIVDNLLLDLNIETSKIN